MFTLNKYHQQGQVNALIGEVPKHKEWIGNSLAQLDTFRIETNALEAFFFVLSPPLIRSFIL